MRLLPRSLAGQLVLATIFALLLAQMVSFVLIMQANREERRAVIAATAAAALADGVERTAAGLPLPQRFGVPRPRGDEMDTRRPERGWQTGQRTPSLRRMSLAAQADLPPDGREDSVVAARVARMLAEADIDVRQVRAVQAHIPPRLRRDGRRISRIMAVAARLPDGRWLTVQAPLADPPARAQWQLAGQTVILFGLLLLPVLWIAQRASAPLARLTQAAATAQPGQMATVAESGPEDVRALSRALNGLNDRIRTLLTDKDRMLGALGHDLRTPLASLRVRVEQVADPQLRAAMSATIADMATMLEDIVALARAGHAQELQEPTDLAALLAGLAADYQAMGKPVRLAAEGSVVSASVRPASLRRALRNLVDNALSYGGSAELGLGVRDGAVVLGVADNGPGIAADRLQEMLEPFARAEESRNRETGGAGLGLALAKAIAEAEGGSLRLRNRAPHGLLAEIWLPKQM